MSGLKEAGKEKAKRTFKRWLLEHNVRMVLIVVIIALLFPFFWLLLMRLLSRCETAVKFTKMAEDYSLWFAFWGSYFGAIVTVILSICTLYMTVRFQKINEKNTLMQQAMGFHKLRIDEIFLYDLAKSFPIDVFNKFNNPGEGRYIFKISFFEPFPPYFTINVKNVGWGEGNENRMDKAECKSVAIENNKCLVLYLLLDPQGDQKKDIAKFYYINYYNSKVMKTEEKTRILRICLDCCNQMDIDEDREYNISLSIDIKVENLSFDENNFVRLNVLNRTIAYRETKDKKYA